MFQELGSTDFWNDGNSNVFRVGLGTSLVVQALRLCTPNAGGSGPIPGQVTGSHTPQLRVCTSQLNIWQATTKTWSKKTKRISLSKLYL